MDSKKYDDLLKIVDEELKNIAFMGSTHGFACNHFIFYLMGNISKTYILQYRFTKLFKIFDSQQ